MLHKVLLTMLMTRTADGDKYCYHPAWLVCHDIKSAMHPLLTQARPRMINHLTSNSTGTHSTSLWLAFLASVQQGRALKRAFVALNGTSTHCHAYWKYSGSLQSRDTSIKGHLDRVPRCPDYRGSTVVGMILCEDENKINFSGSTQIFSRSTHAYHKLSIIICYKMLSS